MVLSMRRIFSVIAVAALMAAVLAASAMPAFAKVKRTGEFFGGELPRNCDFTQTLTCSGTGTTVGGSKDSPFNGKSTSDFTIDFRPENRGDFSISGDSQGGGKDIGGGNCTFTVDGNLLDPGNIDITSEGKGSRCN